MKKKYKHSGYTNLQISTGFFPFQILHIENFPHSKISSFQILLILKSPHSKFGSFQILTILLLLSFLSNSAILRPFFFYSKFVDRTREKLDGWDLNQHDFFRWKGTLLMLIFFFLPLTRGFRLHISSLRRESGDSNSKVETMWKLSSLLLHFSTSESLTICFFRVNKVDF